MVTTGMARNRESYISQAMHDPLYCWFYHLLAPTNAKSIFHFSGVGISLNESLPEELAYVFLSDVRFEQRDYHIRSYIVTNWGPNPRRHHLAIESDKNSANFGLEDPPQTAGTSGGARAGSGRSGAEKGTRTGAGGVDVGGASTTADGAGSSAVVEAGAVGTTVADADKADEPGSTVVAMSIGALQFDCPDNTSMLWVRSSILEEARESFRALCRALDEENAMVARDDPFARPALLLTHHGAAAAATMERGGPDVALAGADAGEERGAKRGSVMRRRTASKSSFEPDGGSSPGGSASRPRGSLRDESVTTQEPALPRGGPGEPKVSKLRLLRQKCITTCLCCIPGGGGEMATVNDPDAAALQSSTEGGDVTAEHLKEVTTRESKLLTLLCSMKNQHSIISMKHFHLQTNRLFLSLDSLTIFPTFRFFARLAESLKLDFLSTNETLKQIQATKHTFWEEQVFFPAWKQGAREQQDAPRIGRGGWVGAMCQRVGVGQYVNELLRWGHVNEDELRINNAT